MESFTISKLQLYIWHAVFFLPDESDSSDDDQPLIKMIKKPPTDGQLKEAIQDLLKDANLEEVTMKQVTRQVCYFIASIKDKKAYWEQGSYSHEKPGKVLEK